MSAKTIRGITIEIDGDTTGLGKALEGVNKQIGNVNYELRQVNSLLKLDPGNTELIAQKQELLAQAIKDTTDKLNTLKTAKEQADERIANGSEEGASEGYRELVRQIASTESSLDKLTKQSEETGNSVEGFAESTKDASKNTSLFADVLKADLLSSAIKKGLSELADGMKKVVSELVDIGKQAVESYANYEQLVGGIDTIFKDSSGKLQEYADEAYKTAGLSANEYMEQATSFSSSLLQSLGGDTEKAVDVANMAITDMADNANKMGTDISSIQNAYQGFAKQNYTMLDNLKLGYGGTKTEMERLLKDAEKFSGVKYDISNLDDVYEAIHVVQEEMGITGTTAQEASETISGSFSTLQASWDNLLVSFASGEDIEGKINSLVESIGNVVNNIIPVIQNVITAIANNLPTMIKTLLPTISSTALSIFKTLTSSLLENLPEILEVGIQVILELVNGITEALPDLVPAIIQAIVKIIETLINNMDQILDTVINTMMVVTDTIIDNIPLIIEGIIKLIVALAKKITEPGMIQKILKAGTILFTSLATALIEYIPELVKKIPDLIDKLKEKLKEGISKIKDVGKDLMSGLWNGIKEKWEGLKDKVSDLGGSIVNKFKSVFGIHSPSTVNLLPL